LATRGLDIPDDIAGAVIRFHPRCPWRSDDDSVIYVPAMICAMRSIAGRAEDAERRLSRIAPDEITAVHRTWLSPEALKIKRRMLGVTSGAAIKLDRDENVLGGLHVGEGVETCLAARQLGLRPTWALGSAGAIAAFPVLSGIESLSLLREHDKANREASVACGTRWHGAGREVFDVWPNCGKDVNDAIRMAR
jgi:hypothetical protein